MPEGHDWFYVLAMLLGIGGWIWQFLSYPPRKKGKR